MYAYDKWGPKVTSNTKSDLIWCFFAQKRYLKATVSSSVFYMRRSLDWSMRLRKDIMLLWSSARVWPTLEGLEKHNEDKWSSEQTERGRGRLREEMWGWGNDCVKEEERGSAVGFSVLLKKEDNYVWRTLATAAYMINTSEFPSHKQQNYDITKAWSQWICNFTGPYNKTRIPTRSHEAIRWKEAFIY